MPKSKTGGTKAATNTADNVSHGGGTTQHPTVDESIVAEILAFTTADYLDDTQKTIYGALLDEIREIEAERETICKDMQLDSWTRDYNAQWNSIRNREYMHCRDQRTAYEAAARIAFAERYKMHVPELEAAYRRICADVVAEMRERVTARLAEYGMTLQDGQNIDAENERREIRYYDPVMWAIMASMADDDSTLNVPYAHTKAEYDVLTLFSDGALIDAMQERANHIFIALDAAYIDLKPNEPAGESVIALTQAIWNEVLPHKWADGTTAPYRYMPGRDVTFPQDRVNDAILHPGRAHTELALLGKTNILVGVRKRATIYARTDGVFAGDLVLLGDDYPMWAYDRAVYIAVISIIDGADVFDPAGKTYIDDIFRQLRPGVDVGKMNAKKRDEVRRDILQALERIGAMRVQVECPLYKEKTKQDIMADVRFPRMLNVDYGYEIRRGRQVPYIVVAQYPPMLKYSKGLQQIKRLTHTWLGIDTPTSSYSILAIGALQVLIETIARMRWMHTTSATIQDADLYRDVGATTEAEKRAVRNAVKRYLNERAIETRPDRLQLDPNGTTLTRRGRGHVINISLRHK